MRISFWTISQTVLCDIFACIVCTHVRRHSLRKHMQRSSADGSMSFTKYIKILLVLLVHHLKIPSHPREESFASLPSESLPTWREVSGYKYIQMIHSDLACNKVESVYTEVTAIFGPCKAILASTACSLRGYKCKKSVSQSSPSSHQT